MANTKEKGNKMSDTNAEGIKVVGPEPLIPQMIPWKNDDWKRTIWGAIITAVLAVVLLICYQEYKEYQWAKKAEGIGRLISPR